MRKRRRVANVCLLFALLSTIWGVPVLTQSCAAQTAPDKLPTRAELDQEYADLAAASAPLQQQALILRRLIRLATPSIVHIDASKPLDDQGRQLRRPIEEAGSGVIVEISDQLFVVTNRHVINDAPLATVRIKLSDGRILKTHRVWSDEETDVAVLAIDVKPDEVHPARIGISRDVDIGDFVLAVGSPFGLSHSVTFGIVSAKGRRDLELGHGAIKYQDFLQTDAAINPGNSGGPLLNLRGEVIGINTAIASSSGGSEGIGFTIPMDMVMTVARQFVQHGRLMRAYLGVRLSVDFTADIARQLGLPRPRGALVSGVTPNTPASKSGVQENDVVLDFDGHVITDDNHLIQVVGFTDVNKEVEMHVFRNGKTQTLHVRLGDKNTFEPKP